jgi:hypothetical protein
MWPGIGDGAPAVISMLSRAPPARMVVTLMSIMQEVKNIDVSFLFIIPPGSFLQTRGDHLLR